MKRCPDCGKDNADDVMECRFCLADLPDSPNGAVQQQFANSGVQQKWKIIVLEGLYPQQTFIADRPQMNIGRADPAQLWEPEIELTKQEQDGSYYVSRKHAQITIRENRAYIADLGSMHGTIVEGKGKVGLKKMELFRGDRVRLGKKVLLLVESE